MTLDVEPSDSKTCAMCLSGRPSLLSNQGMPYHMMDSGIYPCDGGSAVRGQFYELALSTYLEAYELLKKKNDDYSPGPNPFGNFQKHGTKGVLVRLSDKIARLETHESRGTLSNESIKDTIMDICNYAIILLAMKQFEVKP